MKALIIAAAAALVAVAAPASAQDFSGPRVGATVGIAGDKVADTDSKTYGANVGYDLEVTNGIIVGVTGEYQRDFDVRGRDWSATARVGTPVTKNVLLYVGGGYTNVGSGGFNLDGWRALGGAEVAVTKHVFINVEQRYSEYDLGVHANQTVAGVGIRF